MTVPQRLQLPQQRRIRKPCRMQCDPLGFTLGTFAPCSPGLPCNTTLGTCSALEGIMLPCRDLGSLAFQPSVLLLLGLLLCLHSICSPSAYRHLCLASRLFSLSNSFLSMS